MAKDAFKINESAISVGTCTRVALTTTQTITIPGNANSILISADTNPIRFTIDSSTPTSTLGITLAVNQPYRLDLYPGAVLKAIETTASGFLNYQFLLTNK
ncbi:hypothetical protein IQ272_14930 [Chroococcidiopsidales cyanobacterium LEGE 13417]|nr:hypothetical protein [Chroococcidiopsidales cyanobacterium LEGE 13417]